MAALTPRRLPASTLVEVTVAAAILVVVFGLALGSLARLSVSGPQQLQLRGQQLAVRVAAETVRTRAWRDYRWHEGTIELSREVDFDPEEPHLLTLRITATAGGRQLAHLQQLVYAPPVPAP